MASKRGPGYGSENTNGSGSAKPDPFANIHGNGRRDLERASSSHNVSDIIDEENRTGDMGQRESGRRRLAAFLVEMLLIFAVYMAFSSLAPFWTVKAKEMGLPALQIGLLLAIFAGISSIFSIVIHRCLPWIGAKMAFLSGAFLVGGSTIVVGPQTRLSSTTDFFWVSFGTFLVWSIGHAATNTSCTAIISSNFPGNEVLLFGAMEAFIGFGLLFGGPIGSSFYELGGYSLPFYVFGGIVIVLVIFGLLIEPSHEIRRQDTASSFQLICIPSIWTTCLALITTFTLFGIITVGLAIHLTETFDVKEKYTGFFWVLSGFSKMISSSLLSSVIGSNSAAARIILIVSQILGCFTLVLISRPSNKISSYSHTHKFALLCVGLALEGIVKTCVILPALIDLTVTLRLTALPNKLKADSTIAGLFWGVFSFGTFLGPLVGGVLIQYYGFVGACNIGAVVFLIMGVVVAVYLPWEFRCGKGRRKPVSLITRADSTVPEEVAPMLDDSK